MVAAAIAVAEEGVAAGGLPVGAVVVMGDDVIARQLAHADLLAMSAADQRLGWS
jgi:tRNA(adenine34) deaminase